jgi:hypothetical protein
VVEAEVALAEVVSALEEVVEEADTAPVEVEEVAAVVDRDGNG